MAKICLIGLQGKIGPCITTGPPIWHPLPPPRKGGKEEPGIYSEIFVDVSLLDGIHHATKSISDTGTREALQKGIEAAKAALHKRGGETISSITLDE